MTDKTPYNLHEGLGYRLTLAARMNQQKFDIRLSEIGITRQMWCVLIAVGEQGITLPTEIAAYIGINRTSASRSLRQMAQKGLVARGNGTKDKRNGPITLTDDGQRALAASLPMSAKVQDEMGQRLSAPEQAQLFELLGKLLPRDGAPVSGI